MKSLLLSIATASALIAVSATGASAFNMNVPKSVVMAAIAAPTMSSAEQTYAFPPASFLSAAGSYAAHLRQDLIEILAPGIIAGIGAAYDRALMTPITAAIPDLISI